MVCSLSETTRWDYRRLFRAKGLKGVTILICTIWLKLFGDPVGKINARDFVIETFARNAFASTLKMELTGFM